jgi:hypothetical protein
MNKATVLAAVFLLCGVPASQVARADGDADLIKSAESAAPATISSAAAIYAVGSDGKMKTLREGTNGWWCMPDDPSNPKPDPMCGDANSMDWVMAWINHTVPAKGKVGFIYMLQGGADANNMDPYAAPPADGKWVITGPHVMVMNAVDMMAGYKGGPNPDTSRPYIMYEGTPYAHLMIPVQ